jgi:phage protein U
MLYQVGAVTMQTRPFNVDAANEAGSASTVGKPVLGRLAPQEFVGEGETVLTLSGKLLPTRIGGLTELDVLEQYRANGAAVPVIRGDGVVLGNYVVTGTRKDHQSLTRNGVGFELHYSVALTKTSNGLSTNLIGQALTLLGANNG